MNRQEMLKDNKIRAFVTLLEDIREYPYDNNVKKRILTTIEKSGIVFMLDLPEGESFQYYCDKIDDFVYNLIKKDFKK